MKARHISKLRKRISSFKKFKVSSTLGLFGMPYGNWSREIQAKDAVHAVKRYLKCYIRYFKRFPPHYSNCLIETTYIWGRFRVIDEGGFRRYYRCG